MPAPVQQLPAPKQEYDPQTMQAIVRIINQKFSQEDNEEKADAIGKMLFSWFDI